MFSESIGSKYAYIVAKPNSLESLDQVVFRAKRDISQVSPPASLPSVPSPPTQPATVPTNGVTATSNSAGTVPAATGSPATPPKIENPLRLLGVNGTGQRKEYNTTNSAKPVALPPSEASPSQQPSAENKSLTINKSVGAVQPNSSQPSVETPVSDNDDKLIGEIDETEEAINKTVNEHITEDHLASQLPKTDYFQYYNSTTVVDKNKSDEYWSQKKDYIVSSILSKSHRRAIVSRVCDIFSNIDHA